MLGEGIDAAPSCNDGRIKEFLTASSPLQPRLTDKQQDHEDDAVGNKGTSHDEVCQTLAGVVSSAEAKGGDASKHELHPGYNWQCLSHYTMAYENDPANLAVYALLEVELKIDAHGDLSYQHEHDNWDEFGVDVVFGELPPFVFVAKEVPNDGENGAGDL